MASWVGGEITLQAERNFRRRSETGLVVSVFEVFWGSSREQIRIVVGSDETILAEVELIVQCARGRNGRAAACCPGKNSECVMVECEDLCWILWRKHQQPSSSLSSGQLRSRHRRRYLVNEAEYPRRCWWAKSEILQALVDVAGTVTQGVSVVARDSTHVLYMAVERHGEHAAHILTCAGQVEAQRENSEIADENNRCTASDFVEPFRTL